MKKTWLLLAAVLCLHACGEDVQSLPGTEVGCGWFEVDNCYRASLEATRDCLPPSESEGTLAADGKSCSYESGHRIIFTDPVELSAAGMSGKIWDFSLEWEGDFCMAFRLPDENTLVLESSLGSFRVEGSRAGLAMACPAGDLYKVSERDLLLNCDDPEKILPSFTEFWDESGVGFRLSGTGGSPLLIFNCLVE